MHNRPKLWTITATDSSGGAGAFADMKVAQHLGCECQAVVIAVTAQNSQGVIAAQPLELSLVKTQWQALAADGWPAVIRLGWLPAEPELLSWLVQELTDFQGTVIWDPVLAASQGSALTQTWQTEVIYPYFLQLLGRADLITPNVNEARILTGLAANSNAADCAAKLVEMGAKHVLITGLDTFADRIIDTGTDKEQIADYFLYSNKTQLGKNQLPGASLLTEFYLNKLKLNISPHGTGCHLAASLACLLAKEVNLYDALTQAVCSTSVAIKQSSHTRQGAGNAWASDYHQAQQHDWPLVLSNAQQIKRQPTNAFNKLQRPLGVYGLVDNLAHLERLIQLDVDTLQWRVKHPDEHYQSETQHAIKLCKDANIPLFINDDWRLAIELNAYGVHLGQEDLANANLNAIQRAGLHLGISTHSDWEVARARAIQPSYIALGPIFKPLSKELKYEPLGLERLANYVARFPDICFTCIGGITQHNAAQVWQTGVESIAVVTDLANDLGLEGRLLALRKPRVKVLA
jgi:hydroxymethylpyrimidine kinase/phosphomethylpyrimidine kinase/thiamine-phosphate diphosphorylase